MAKKKNQKRELIDYKGDKHLSQESIGDYNEQGVLRFSKNVNIMRLTPDLHDGLKVVHRRILYCLYKLKDTPNKKPMKSAKIIGDLIGQWHPHGDSAAYEAMINLSQHWKTPQPLIRFVGNKGNMQGDPYAGMRYTHSGLSFYAWKCFFEDFNIRALPTRPNFLETDVEPEYLPSRYPNILINPHFGIGVGASISTPSYNFNEVIEATKKLMNNPEAKILLIPDIPSGCDILEGGDFKEIFEEGRGKFIQRAEIEVDEDNNELTVYSLPLRVSVNTITKKIIDLHDDKVIPEFHKFEDDTTNDTGVQLTIKLRRGADVYAFRQLLYKKTSLQDTFSSYITAVDDYREYDMGIRELLLRWIDDRREYKILYFNARYKDLQEKIHITKLLLSILSNKKDADRIVSTIRNAESDDEIRDFLMKAFKVTSLQAKAIADMKTSTFSKKGILKLELDLEDYEAEAKFVLPYTQANKEMIDAIILGELDEGAKLFGHERRSNIISLDGEISIQQSNHVLVMTANGKIKKLEADVDSIGAIESGDRPTNVLEVNNQDNIMIFDQYGKVHKLPVHKIISHDIRSHGQDLKEYISLSGQVIGVHVMPKDGDVKWDNSTFVFITENGTIKKTHVNKFKDIRSELMGVILKDGDLVKDVLTISGDKRILVYTEKGFGGYFDSSEITETSRVSMGVKSIDMKPDDKISGISKFSGNEEYILVVTDNGKLKKCTLDAFPQINRAGKPLALVKTTDNILKFAIPVFGDERVAFTQNEKMSEMAVSDIPDMPRMSTGKKLVGVKKGDSIIDVRILK